MFNIESLLLHQPPPCNLSVKSVQEKQKKREKKKHFSFEKHHPQHTAPSKNTKRYNTNNISNSMETPAAPLSSFKVPEVGDKFIDKECIHRYVYDYIRFTSRNIAPNK